MPRRSQLGQEQVQTVGYTALAVASGIVIYLCVNHSQTFHLGGLFLHPWLRFLGKYSYGLYVFHFPIMIFSERILPTARLADQLHSPLLSAAIHSIIVATASVAVAFGSWHLYEKLFLRLKPKYANESVLQLPDGEQVAA